MNTVCWALVGALILCGSYLALPTHAAPQMHMIENPNCFPVGTTDVEEGFPSCTGDVYRMNMEET